jgi:hypothetical protein
MPGLIELLPDPACFPDAAPLYQNATWRDVAPLQEWLDASLQLKPLFVEKAFLERCANFVTLDYATAAAITIGDAGPQVSGRLAGDGTVAAPAMMLDGVPAYQVRMPHTLIPWDRGAITGVTELLRTGSCSLPAAKVPATVESKLESSPPATRDELLRRGLRVEDVQWLFEP